MRTGIRIGKYDSYDTIAAKNAERQRLQALYNETRGAELKRLKAEDRARRTQLSKVITEAQIKDARKRVAAEHRELKKLARAREREEIKMLKKLDQARQREQPRGV